MAARQHAQHRAAVPCAELPRRPLRQHVERQRLQRIAGQDRRAFVERLVAGRPAAAQVVVVHRRQVVVDQAVGVDQLDRGGRRVERLERRAERFAGEYTSVGRRRLPAPRRVVLRGSAARRP